MKNKGSENISESELDGLLKQAFLNLDFETNATNKKLLTGVSEQAMSRKGIFDFFTSYRFNLFFLIFSLFACFSSLYRYTRSARNFEIENIQAVEIINKAEIKQVKNISVVPIFSSKRLASSEKKSTQLKTKIGPHRQTKNKKNYLVSKKTKGTDTVFVIDKTSIALPDSLSQIERLDTLNPATPIQSIAASVTAKNYTPKNKKTEKLPKPEVKSKTKKMRADRRFRKDGTFRMKGGRYGKSKRPYHP